MWLLRGEQAEKTIKTIKKKEPLADVESLIEVDEKVLTLKSSVEKLRAERNELSAKAAGGITPEVREKSIELGKKIKETEKHLAEVEGEYGKLLLCLPNIIEDDVPSGNKESNKVVKTYQEKPTLGFEPKNHLELNEKLGWFDFESGSKMSGAQFLVYRKDGLKLLYALTQLMIRHNAHAGFEPVLPPYLVKRESMVKSSNLPKFEGDFYDIQDEDLSLIPTAEVALTNLYADKIFKEKDLPIRHSAWTSCFRREAGGYGSLERGLIRIHQFEKVEIYSICKPEDSSDELNFLVQTAESFLQKLGLHYQVSLLAAQDTSFASARTYDVEVWLPGQKSYYEVSSCSNVKDFQARRAQIRFKRDGEKKTTLAHTLNASSLALPRLMVALLETYQQEDGSVKFPEILQKEMDNLW
jgi:seryl-tRNA synthetase